MKNHRCKGKCKRLYPVTIEFFNYNTSNKSGFSTKCIKCEAARFIAQRHRAQKVEDNKRKALKLREDEMAYNRVIMSVPRNPKSTKAYYMIIDVIENRKVQNKWV